MDILIELGVALVWIGILLLIFNPKFVPQEKRNDYRSRKLRFAIVVFGVITGFYSIGKIDSFELYRDFVVFLFLIISGANVADKFVGKKPKDAPDNQRING